jgi:5-methylcytosine-specific restriction protein A
MSRHRISPKAGWCNPDKLDKGPNGRNLCRQCGEEVPSARRTFCSQACVDEWTVRTNPGHARRLVFKRDRGVCAVCGLDTEALKQELWRLRGFARALDRWERKINNVSARTMTFELQRETPLTQRLRRLGLPRHLWCLSKSFWEMDHTVPVVEGGGECGLDNLRTLCWSCHARATRQLRGRRARWQQLELVFR